MVMLHEFEHLPNTLNHIQQSPECLLLAQADVVIALNNVCLWG